MRASERNGASARVERATRWGSVFGLAQIFCGCGACILLNVLNTRGGICVLPTLASTSPSINASVERARRTQRKLVQQVKDGYGPRADRQGPTHDCTHIANPENDLLGAGLSSATCALAQP